MALVYGPLRRPLPPVTIRVRAGRAGLVMSMLSSKAKYALRAVVFLAEKHRDQTWALASDIAEAEDIPKKFLEAILVELRDHGIIDSRRGRYGGYRLAHPPSRIAVGDVIRIIDGPLALTPCSSRTQYGACADCVDPVVCALRPVLQEARDAVATVLDGCTLAQLVRGRRSKSSVVRRVVA
jgi:Rrf2 family protein